MKFLVSAIVSFLTQLISLILGPINTLIINNLPGLNDLLGWANDFLTWLSGFVNWVFSWLPFTQEFMSALILLLIFKVTVPLLIDMIKLVVKWWHALVP